jgi:hypothetical protein
MKLRIQLLNEDEPCCLDFEFKDFMRPFLFYYQL